MSKTVVLILLVLYSSDLTYSDSSESKDPPGHMKPLGSHRPPEGGIETIDYFPSPHEFYNKYVSASVPVLFKGVAKTMPGYQWTDEYLSNKYGSLSVEVEVGKKENRSWGTFQDTLKSFIKHYNEKDAYLVETVPQVMHDEVIVPKSLTCGGFTSLFQDVIIWFSSGGTKSVLHFDGIDNINCLFSGSKEFFIVDKKEKDKVGIDVPSGAYSAVDVDQVDMYKYPGLSTVPWYQVFMRPGDCLFLPTRWFHQVRSSNERNLAVNLWFAHLFKFNQTDCDISQFKDDEMVPLSKFEVDANEGSRQQILQMMDGKSQSFEDWMYIFQDQMDLDLLPESLDKVRKGFDILDSNSDGYISPEELKKPPVDQVIPLLPRDGPPSLEVDVDGEEVDEEGLEGGNNVAENEIPQSSTDDPDQSENTVDNHQEL